MGIMEAQSAAGSVAIFSASAFSVEGSASWNRGHRVRLGPGRRSFDRRTASNEAFTSSDLRFRRGAVAAGSGQLSSKSFSSKGDSVSWNANAGSTHAQADHKRSISAHLPGSEDGVSATKPLIVESPAPTAAVEGEGEGESGVENDRRKEWYPWNAMIEGFVKCKDGQAALDVAKRMEHEGVEPNTATFVGLLHACASIGAIEEGRRFHQQVIERGLELQMSVGSGLIHMYCQCGQIRDAWRVFNNMPIRDVKTWNAMIEGCVKCNRPYNVLEIYPAMYKEGVEPDVETFAGVVNACRSLGALQEGMLVHAQICQRGFESEAPIRISLINMYTQCRRMEEAWKVFNQRPDREISCWNAMIHGYARCGQGHKALELFSRMRLENLQPSMDTFLAVLDACANLGALEEGKRLHAEISELGYDSDRIIIEKLNKMYAKCKALRSSGFQQRPAYGPGSLGATLIK